MFHYFRFLSVQYSHKAIIIVEFEQFGSESFKIFRKDIDILISAVIFCPSISPPWDLPQILLMAWWFQHSPNLEATRVGKSISTYIFHHQIAFSHHQNNPLEICWDHLRRQDFILVQNFNSRRIIQKTGKFTSC